MSHAPLLDPPQRADVAATPRLRRPTVWRSWVISWLAVMAVVVWVVWRTGPRAVPNLQGFAAVAADWPSATIDSGFAYTLRVPLGQMFYRMLGTDDPTAFLVLHAGCLVIVAVLITVWLCRRIGMQTGLLAGCILLLAPITPVLLLWIGMYDAFSMLAWTLVLMSFDRGPRLQFAAALVAGFQNFEQSAVGLLLILLLPALARGAGWTLRALPLIAGLAAGKAVLEIGLAEAGAASGDRVSYLLDDSKGLELLTSVAAAAPILLWSALGGLWIYAVLAGRTIRTEWRPRDKVMLAVAVALWFGSGALAEDQTRVLALTSVPVVVAAAIIIALRHHDLVRFVRSPSAWVLFLAPPLVLWNNNLIPLGVPTDDA